LLNEAQTHTHTQKAGKPKKEKKIITAKRRKSKYGTVDLDLLWMEQGIALCLPVDLYRCISLVLTHVVFLSFLYGFKALYDDS